MFAPSELLIFISLFSVAAAFPQASIPANTTVTTTYAGEAGPTVTLTLVELKSCLVTYDPVLCSGRDIVELPTATGWYDTKVDSYIVGPPTQTDVVVTSNIPTIVTIETNTAIHNVVPVTSGASNNELEGDDAKPATTTQADRNNSLDTPEQPADSPTGANPIAVPSNPQQTAQNSLLLNIVSELGGTQPTAQPTHPSSPTTVESDAAPGLTQGPSSPSSSTSDAINVVPGVAPGNSITLGSATLTLTPGISTTIGPTSDLTFIAMTTDAAGNTLVTVSSSGIAVTATVSTVSAIVTLPKTGFEASITDVARPRDYTSSMSSSFSSGAAACGRNEVHWWTGVVLGMAGVVFEM